MPHGATFFPALRLPLLYDIEDEYPLFFINKWFLLIPGFVGMVKLFSGLIASERGNLKLAILQNARPLIIYPNGAKEVLHNSSKNGRRLGTTAQEAEERDEKGWTAPPQNSSAS